MPPVQPRLADEEPNLHTVLENVWHLLDKGVRDRRHGFHLPCLATWNPDFGPTARHVVLRGLDRKHRLLRFHTDARSGKAAEIAAEPRVALTFYDPGEETQVRAQAHAELHRSDAAAEAAWQKTRLFSRRCYLAQQAPGTPTEVPTAGLPFGLVDRSPTAEESEAGRANFAIVLCRIESLDWMYLSHMGHRRARFAWTAEGEVDARWLQP